jgi:ADP-dependent NAD(P)H-hydrate dehydratase / NAD(P)H-hydrate epimerase
MIRKQWHILETVMKILTAKQIREIDRLSSEQFGIPGILLMENAGMRVVEALEERFENLEDLTIGILCGKGNNGGDGFVVARQLIQKGTYPYIFLLGRGEDVTGDAKTNFEILKAIGYPPTVIGDAEEWSEEKVALLDADIIIDAMLGTGLTKPVSGLYAEVIDSLREDFPKAEIISIDLPSGLPADGAHPIGPAVEADATVTFTALKPCLVLSPNQEYAGDVILADIGNPAELLDSSDLMMDLIVPEKFEAAVRARSADTNKGDYGKILVIGGSIGKSGAAAMTGQAALRSGAGLVTVATPESVVSIVATSMPELMTAVLPENDEGLVALLNDKTVLAIGPGLGSEPSTQKMVRSVVQAARIPTIVDADGLNAFAGQSGSLRGEDGRPVIITPHPGEMARLTGESIEFITSNRVDSARDFSVTHNVFVVLKGFRTVVAVPDGSVYINITGNPGMATGGTGDILTGIIAGIVAQEHFGSLVERLCLAVYLHGLSGDLAADELGEESLVATDILRFLHSAWEQLRQ